MTGLFSSFRGRLFVCFLVVAAAALLLPLQRVRPMLHDALLRDAFARLQQQAELVRVILNKEGKAGTKPALIALKREKIRLTLMDSKGFVLFDSGLRDGETADNHADRPEVSHAMQVGGGEATRFSATLQQQLIYTALRLENGDILRLAAPFEGLERRITSQWAELVPAVGAAVLLALFLAWFFSRRMEASLSAMVRGVEGISLGNFSRRLHNVPGRELRPLADAVNRMAESIEELLRAEADQKGQLETVLETLAEGVLVFGLRGRIRRVNRALAEYFPAADGADGHQLVEAVPAPALQEALSALLADPQGHGKSVELRIEVGRRIFSVLLARPREGLGHKIGAVAAFREITELVRLENVRRDFVANVSHELRTPLTAIRGCAETLEDMPDVPEQARRFAGVIRRHSVFLSGMVDELLTLSRLENDAVPMEPGPTDPRRALAGALRFVEEAVAAKRLRVAEELEDASVAVGQSQLERVLRNLLENACRYAPEESEIRVRIRIADKEALFSVADQGPGIPPRELGRIFERFYRVEKHHVAPGGLGLAICRHIVERSGGRIWAESPAEDAACAFFFTLPLADAGDMHG